MEEVDDGRGDDRVFVQIPGWTSHMLDHPPTALGFFRVLRAIDHISTP